MSGDVKYDKHYAESDAACGDPFAPMVQFAQGLDAGASVLDLGCGQGRDALVFARAGHRVRGVDVSSVGVAQLNALAEAEGLDVEAVVGDVVSYEPQGRFDVVVLDRVLHMLAGAEVQEAVLRRAAAATRPGGWVLVSEYPKQLPLVRAVFDDPQWRVDRDAKGFVFAQRVAAERTR